MAAPTPISGSPGGIGPYGYYALLVPEAGTGHSLIEYLLEPSEQAAAESFPGVTVLGGPFFTASDAEVSYPQGSNGSTAAYQAGSTTNPNFPPDNWPSNPLDWLASIGDFFSKLSSPNLWIRVGEVGVGALVLYLGAKAMFPQTVNMVTAPIRDTVKTGTKAAATVAVA